MLDFAGEPSLGFLIDRMKESKNVDKIVLATTRHPEDEALVKLAQEKEIAVFRGGETEERRDLLGSFIECAEQNGLDTIVRICGDSPLIEPSQIDRLLEEFEQGDYDYLSIKTRDGNPIILSGWGLAVEVISLEAFKKARMLASDKISLEHVTPFIYKNPDIFKVWFLDYPKMSKFDHDDVRLTIDYKYDLDTLNEIANNLNGKDPNLDNFIEYLNAHPNILAEMKERNNASKKKV